MLDIQMASPSVAEPAGGGELSALSQSFRAIAKLLRANPHLKPRYDYAREVIRGFRRPALYEVETRCNLKCEGCYYFEGGTTHSIKGETDPGAWESFFADEGRRGVTMAYFLGAEPALCQDRLRLAIGKFPHANIGSNGTIKIHRDIPFRIAVSVWAGDDASDVSMRGASVFRKALRNYAGDERAIMVFTISRWTIDQAPAVAKMCEDNGVKLTFNLYSPTETFLDRIAAQSRNDDKFFRVSNREDSPLLRPEDLLRANDVLNQAVDDWPDTVVYSKAYNDYMCAPGPRFDIDPTTGMAVNCGSRILEPMRYFSSDLKQAAVKCGSSASSCAECRMYSGGWSSRLIPRARDVESVEAFSDWLDMLDKLNEIFLYPRIQRPEEKALPELQPSRVA